MVRNVDVPLNAGHNFHTPRPPTLRYCPRDNSRKNMGIPAKNSVIKQGTRNAPTVTINTQTEVQWWGATPPYILLGEQRSNKCFLNTHTYFQTILAYQNALKFTAICDDQLFSRINTNSLHILQQYLSDRPSLNYSLRPRPHNITLITKTSVLNHRDFIIRNINKDLY